MGLIDKLSAALRTPSLSVLHVAGQNNTQPANAEQPMETDVTQEACEAAQEGETGMRVTNPNLIPSNNAVPDASARAISQRDPILREDTLTGGLIPRRVSSAPSDKPDMSVRSVRNVTPRLPPSPRPCHEVQNGCLLEETLHKQQAKKMHPELQPRTEMVDQTEALTRHIEKLEAENRHLRGVAEAKASSS